MKIQCPNCGKSITVRGLGRPTLAMPFKIVCDTVLRYSSVSLASKHLGCSRALIYKILKTNGMTPADLIKGKTKA